MLFFSVLISLKEVSQGLQMISSLLLWGHVIKYIVELALSKATPEFLFLSGKGTKVYETDGIKLYQRTKQKQNLSLIISWIDFKHHSLCTSDNFCDIPFVLPMCQHNHERINSGKQLKCFNFSTVFNVSNMDNYYILFSMLISPIKYLSWQEASDICQKWNSSLPSFESRRDTTLFSKFLILSKTSLPSEAVFVGMDPLRVGFFFISFCLI